MFRHVITPYDRTENSPKIVFELFRPFTENRQAKGESKEQIYSTSILAVSGRATNSDVLIGANANSTLREGHNMYKMFKSYPFIVSAALYASFLFSFLFVVWLLLSSNSSATGNYLTLDIEYFGSPASDLVQFYINDQGMPNKPYQIKMQSPGRHKIAIKLMDTRLTKMRLDPISTKDREFKIHRLTIEKRDNRGVSYSYIDISNPDCVFTHDIAPLPDGRMRASGNYPMINFVLDETLPQAKGSILSASEIGSFAAVLFMFVLWWSLFLFWKRRALEDQKANLTNNTFLLPFSKLQFLIATLAGVFFFMFVCFCKPSYAPSSIIIYGLSPEMQNIRCSWDSGDGFSLRDSMVRTIEKGTVEFTLPLIRVDRVTFDKPLPSTASLSLFVRAKEKKLNRNNGNDTTISINHADRANPNIIQVSVQIVASFIVFLSILAATRLFSHSRELALWIASEHRYVFFIVSCFSLPFFIFWLVGQWPGAMTNDSVFIWNVTKTFSFTAAHPTLNALFFLFAQQFYDSPATVALIQILLFAGLLAYILHFLYCCKVPLLLLTCFAVPPLIAVPIGLYNIMLWKDIPFMLSIVFWGFFLYKNYLISQMTGQRLIKTGWEMFFLGVSLLGFLFRHGGGVCIFLVIICLVISRIFEWKTTARISVICAVVYLMFTQILPMALRENSESLPFYNAYTMLNPMGALYINGYYTPTRTEDIQALKKFIPSEDNLKAYFPCYVYPIANKGTQSDIGSNDADRIVKTVFKAALLNPGIFLADRIAIFFSSLNEMRIGIYALTYSNILRTSDLSVSYPESINIQYLQIPAIMPRLAEMQEKLIAASHRVSTLFCEKHIIWNATGQFFLLIGVLLLGRWLPASALYSLFVLSFSAVTFLTICVNQFRYIYYIYVGGLFILPMVLAEIIQIRRLKNDPHSDCILNLPNVQSSCSQLTP